MYDLKSEAHEFIAESRQDAVAKAVAFYGVEEAELKISQPEEGRVYGVGGRTVVVAQPRNAVRSPREPRESREPRGRDRDRDDRRGERGGRRRDRDDRPRRSEGRDGRRERGATRPERRASSEESKATVMGELGDVGKFVAGAVERMRLGPFEISETGEGDFLIVQLHGDAAIALGAGDGRAVDALQLLANQAAMRDNDDPPRVVVDAEGDSERRESFLTRLAERAARRAVETRRSVALDPMNSRDRRILHVAVREIDGVATMSVGSGRYRQVVIAPEGSSEYEEAVKASEAAESRD